MLEVYKKEPEGFKAEVEASGCYLEIDGKILFLQCASGKRQAGKWGVPAGKLEKEESPENAAKRELFEETGISLKHPSDIQHVVSLYVRKPDMQYVYHLFKVKLEKMPTVCLSDEHESYKWATAKELEEMPLMTGAKEALHHYRILHLQDKQHGKREG